MSDNKYREQLMTELADRYHPVKRTISEHLALVQQRFEAAT